MPALLGLFGTGDFAANQAPENWRETILYLEPEGDTPLIALSSQMATKPTDDPRFHWWTEKYEARILTVDGGAGVGVAGDSVAVDVHAFGNYCPKGVLLFCPLTGEYLQVNTDPTVDTQLTVTRGFGLVGGTAVSAIPDETQLTVIGSAYAEGSGAPKAIHRVPVEESNFTQIFKTTIDITRTARKTRVRTGDKQYEHDKMRALRRHMQDLERAAFFGIKSQSIGANGKPLRTTGGLLNFMQTNVQDYGGNATYNQLDDFFQQLFLYGPPERLAFCGNQWISKLNFLIDGRVHYKITAPITTYGMELQTLVTPYGTVRYKRHPGLTTDPFYNNSAWYIAPGNMVYRPLDDTFIMPDVHQPDLDMKMDQYITEAGFEFHHEETFGRQTNL